MENKFFMTQDENIFYAKRNIVDSIYKSARLERIAITFPETCKIYEGRTVSGLSVDDMIKVNNLKRAWQFVFDTVDYPIDLRYIKQVDQLIEGGRIPLSGTLRQMSTTPTYG